MLEAYTQALNKNRRTADAPPTAGHEAKASSRLYTTVVRANGLTQNAAGRASGTRHRAALRGNLGDTDRCVLLCARRESRENAYILLVSSYRALK